MGQPFDPVPILAELVRHKVRFVVVGGLAAVVQGSPLVTGDVDICYERIPENMERLVRALRELGARLRGAPDDVPFQLDVKTIAAGDAFTFTTDAGSLDCLGTPAGTQGYEDLEANAVEVDLGEHTILVASVTDLIRMKRASGRRKDLAVLSDLEALRDELEEG